MPAEWETHEATWIGWPSNRTDWPGKFSPIPWVYGEIARKITLGEQLRILVQDATHQKRALSILRNAHVDLAAVEFFHIPSDRGWTRDSGPMFVRGNKKKSPLSIIDFRFNGWAKYSDHKKDNAVPAKAAKALGLDRIVPTYKGKEIVLEWGAIDVNGQGTLITTEECLLHPSVQVRNPGFTREDYEEIFAAYLGINNTIWLKNGIAGDDTHGHVDDLCRFVSPDTVVIVQEKDRTEVNYRPLKENKELLESADLENGKRLQVVSLPMPSPLYFQNQRLPASYANFYITNTAVLVPTFNDPKDHHALGILSELFPERMVTGIHAVDLVLGLGTLHCLTQQQPSLV